MARLLLLGPAREAAGTREATLEGATVSAVLEAARARFGESFAAVLATSQVWVNGEPADPELPVAPYDEVAVLPPVSGG